MARGSIEKQGKESWLVTIELGRDPASKKRRRRFLTVRGTKKDAERARTAALAQVDQGIDLAPTKATAGEFLRRWLRDWAQNNVAASTFERYKGIVENHLIPVLGHLRLSDLRPLHVQAAITTWLEPGSRCDGNRGALTRRTVSHHYRVLSEALNQAVKLQLIPRNPCDSVDPPRPPQVEMQALNETETRAFLEAARSEFLYAFFHTSVTTGARLGELLALHWHEVDLDGGRIAINQTVRRFAERGYEFKSPKTKRSRRTIALDAETSHILQEHRRCQIEQRLLVGPAYKDNDLVFATLTGGVLGDSTVRTTFNRILRTAGLRRIRIHDLRHTAATLMMRAGVNPKVVSERLGHSTIAITLDTYSHVMPDMQRDAAEALAGMLR